MQNIKSENLKQDTQKKLLFPAGFLWGVATSAYQVEGGCDNNDWYEWEKRGKTKSMAGKACDSWNKYPEDHDLAQELGCNAFRLSLEWSKIEPEEGKFSEEAIEHYRKVLQDIKSKGMMRSVTLWHWTLPLWLSKNGGWHKKHTVKYFTEYCKKVIEELGDEIDQLLIMNEPRLPLNRGYLVGDFPPGKRNPLLFLLARKNMVAAHKMCYEFVKKEKPDLPVGITQFCNDFDYYGFKTASFITEKVEDFYNWYFYEQLKGHYDFVGINYYFAVEIKLFPPSIRMQTVDMQITEMGWGVFPEGLYEVVMDAWKRYKKPIYIFENGIANAADDHRTAFIKGHLKKLQQAIVAGANVKGYFHWSLLDNFEWNEAYNMKFGLVEVDFETLERKPRKSFYEYAKICKNNAVELG